MNQAHSSSDTQQALPCRAVVGIGASAGGLNALERFFAAVPEKTGLAFVVVQHLSPDFKSLMEDLLARHTKLPIHRVEDGMPLAADTIFLNPPKMDMSLQGSCFQLVPKHQHGRQDGNILPIDVFFSSLAQHGRQAIAITLSGTGSDGSRGAKRVYECGGLVLIQDPQTAEFPGMPEATLATGIVAIKDRAERLPALVLEALDQSKWPTLGTVSSKPDASPLEQILALLERHSGIDFSDYKNNTIERRIQRRMQMRAVSDMRDYASIVGGGQQELEDLLHDLLIGVTGFWRDPEAFMSLRDQILPTYLKERQEAGEFRLWVPGCASGEEAYSLAMLLHDVKERCGFSGTIRVFATDVHRPALERASQAHYSTEDVNALPESYQQRYVVPVSDRLQRISQSIREMVVFAPHNLLCDPPFTRLDMVSCRNLLIYFNPESQDYALSLFRYCLKKEGILFQGSSESLGNCAEDFQILDQRWKVYRKLRGGPLPGPGKRVQTRETTAIQPRISSQGSTAQGRLLYDYELLLKYAMLSGFLLTADRQLLHVFGEAGQWIRHRDGRVSHDIIDLLPESLAPAIASLIQRVSLSRQSVNCRNVSVPAEQPEHGSIQADLFANPLPDPSGQEAPHILIAVRRSEAPVQDRTPSSDMSLSEIASQRMRDLEMELLSTKENLQATIEELQTTNEELQSTNEELQSANQELQSSNEELHSVNEELYTVNSEYEHKNRVLADLNRDHKSLLDATDVGIIFLDQDQQIRRYNSAALRWFRLIPQDIGRPLLHIANDMPDADRLSSLIAEVNSGHGAHEQHIQVGQGGHVLRRILPYRNDDGIFVGTLLTCTDITAVTQAEAQLNQHLSQQAAFFRLVSDAILVIDDANHLQDINDAGRKLLGLDDSDHYQGLDLAGHFKLCTASGQALSFAEALSQQSGEALQWQDQQQGPRWISLRWVSVPETHQRLISIREQEDRAS